MLRTCSKTHRNFADHSKKSRARLRARKENTNGIAADFTQHDI